MSDITDPNSPKSRLMKHVNLQPRQVMVVSESNGAVTVDISYLSGGDALYMFYQLEKYLRAAIEGQTVLPTAPPPA